MFIQVQWNNLPSILHHILYLQIKCKNPDQGLDLEVSPVRVVRYLEVVTKIVGYELLKTRITYVVSLRSEN